MFVASIPNQPLMYIYVGRKQICAALSFRVCRVLVHQLNAVVHTHMLVVNGVFTRPTAVQFSFSRENLYIYYRY